MPICIGLSSKGRCEEFRLRSAMIALIPRESSSELAQVPVLFEKDLRKLDFTHMY